ncbi:MAG: DUF705 domain-containing protein [Sulfurovum sp.]
MKKPFYIYIDVDETFVRNYIAKRIAIPSVIEHIKQLKNDGATLYCWSSGGAEYAKASAKEFGIEECFVGFLPKPQVMIDDMNFSQWRNLLQIHPNETSQYSVEGYQEKLKNK